MQVRTGTRRISRIRVSSLEGVTRVLNEHGVCSVVLDVEPLICRWNTDSAALDDGLSAMFVSLEDVETLTHVALVTNSKRVPAEVPRHGAFVVTYREDARKPWGTLRELRVLPRPLVVVGDQPLTDGLLAWRLDSPFVQITLPRGTPASVRLQARLGEFIRRFVFSA